MQFFFWSKEHWILADITTIFNKLSLRVKKDNKQLFSSEDSAEYLLVIFFRGKKILEKLSRTRFFREFENPALFPLLRSRGEKGGNFKSRKKLVLESCTNIFFHSSH